MDALLHSLNIDPMLLLWNGVLFLLLLLVLNGIFWKPMMKHLDNRKAEITGAYKAVEATRRDLEDLRTEYQARLVKIEAEARGQIQSTVRDAQTERERLIAEARAQAEEVIRSGQASIALEKDQTVAAMRESLASVAADALARTTGAPPDAAQRRLIDERLATTASRS